MKANTMIRVDKKHNPFVMLDKRFIDDDNLSWKAKGLLAYLLSKPDDWTIYVTDLIKHSKSKKDATNSGINELVKANYIERYRKRDELGRFSSYKYTVYEYPKRETHSGKPVSNKNNTSKNNINKNIKYIKSSLAEETPMAYSSFSYSVFKLFTEKYNNYFVKLHPYYRIKLLEECLIEIDSAIFEFDLNKLNYWETIIDTYLDEFHKKGTDCHFRLFITGETIQNYYNRLLL